MIVTTKKSDDYELLDSGDGEKLERFGMYILRRPDPEVLWNKMKPEVWETTDAHFSVKGLSKKWKVKTGMPQLWQIQVGDIKLILHLGTFKHVGFFPEQISNWNWMGEKVKSQKSKVENEEQKKKIKILNLFGYTGGASCVLAKVDADVTHVDASPSAVEWAKENAQLNNISNIRFIVDDVRKFVEREIKRGARYDAILMDPPVYGKGNKKQSKEKTWHIEEDFLPLLARTAQLLSSDPLFFSVSGYASEYSHLSYANALQGVFSKTTIESGELAIQESDSPRLLPAGIFARVKIGKIS